MLEVVVYGGGGLLVGFGAGCLWCREMRSTAQHYFDEALAVYAEAKEAYRNSIINNKASTERYKDARELLDVTAMLTGVRVDSGGTVILPE